MTPFQVYLWMQADSICNIFGTLALLGGLAFLITTIGRHATASLVTKSDIENHSDDWLNWQMFVKLHRWAIAVFFPSLFISILMPNTKTITTMIVLPKITSPDWQSTVLQSRGL